MGKSTVKMIRITPIGVIQITKQNELGVIRIIPATFAGENLQNLYRLSSCFSRVVFHTKNVCLTLLYLFISNFQQKISHLIDSYQK